MKVADTKNTPTYSLPLSRSIFFENGPLDKKKALALTCRRHNINHNDNLLTTHSIKMLRIRVTGLDDFSLIGLLLEAHYDFF